LSRATLEGSSGDVNNSFPRSKALWQILIALRLVYKSYLSKQQEKDLIAYINKLIVRGLPLTLLMVKNFAEDLAKREFGKPWACKFV